MLCEQHRCLWWCVSARVCLHCGLRSVIRSLRCSVSSAQLAAGVCRTMTPLPPGTALVPRWGWGVEGGSVVGFLGGVWGESRVCNCASLILMAHLKHRHFSRPPQSYRDSGLLITHHPPLLPYLTHTCRHTHPPTHTHNTHTHTHTYTCMNAHVHSRTHTHR